MHKQRGNRAKMPLFRGILWLSLSTSCYITSAAHVLFQKQFEAFGETKGEGLFALRNFDGSYLMGIVLAFILIITFFFVYGPPILDEYKTYQRKRLSYSIFLLYFLASFVTFYFTRHYALTGLWT